MHFWVDGVPPTARPGLEFVPVHDAIVEFVTDVHPEGGQLPDVLSLGIDPVLFL